MPFRCFFLLTVGGDRHARDSGAHATFPRPAHTHLSMAIHLCGTAMTSALEVYSSSVCDCECTVARVYEGGERREPGPGSGRGPRTADRARWAVDGERAVVALGTRNLRVARASFRAPGAAHSPISLPSLCAVPAASCSAGNDHRRPPVVKPSSPNPPPSPSHRRPRRPRRPPRPPPPLLPSPVTLSRCACQRVRVVRCVAVCPVCVCVLRLETPRRVSALIKNPAATPAAAAAAATPSRPPFPLISLSLTPLLNAQAPLCNYAASLINSRRSELSPTRTPPSHCLVPTSLAASRSPPAPFP